MKTVRNSVLCLGLFLLASTILRAQDFSKYRGFSLGSSMATMLKQTDRKPTDVKVIHARPTLIQELTWWPPAVPGASYRADSVEQMLFSFCNGELYKISVNYDTASTQGLTTSDMVKSISEKYGPATVLETAPDSALTDRYSNSEKTAASWEDSQYFFKLVRSAFTNHFGLIIFSKKVNAEAELAIADAVTLEKQEKPQRDADLKKKEADDLEAERLKNQKTFRP
ncbi:MAG TPA: hypothetical protein VNO32_15970 [Candidatus Acidoferrum sp.]|nr:hypothetical protein [Candidatus Acidoferrum sp.]